MQSCSTVPQRWVRREAQKYPNNLNSVGSAQSNVHFPFNMLPALQHPSWIYNKESFQWTKALKTWIFAYFGSFLINENFFPTFSFTLLFLRYHGFYGNLYQLTPLTKDCEVLIQDWISVLTGFANSDISGRSISNEFLCLTSIKSCFFSQRKANAPLIVPIFVGYFWTKKKSYNIAV